MLIRHSAELTSHLTSSSTGEERQHMASWHVQDAKARFSELLEETIRMGPQIVTRRPLQSLPLFDRHQDGCFHSAAGYNLRAHADSFLQQFAETGRSEEHTSELQS